MLSTRPVECPASLLAQAQQCAPMAVAVANATTPLVLESARVSSEHGLLTPILIGDAAAIRAAAATIDWDIAGCRIEAAATEEAAAKKAVALAASGDADAIMKGNVHTDVLLRAVLDRDTGLRTGQLLSHVFHMSVPGEDRALCITDAVLNVAPTLEQKASILLNAVALLKALGNETPRVALLSAAETESAAMPSSVDAAELARQAQQGAFPGTIVEGPLAFDLAVSAEAAKIKGVTSAVAGNTDLLLVPNIETGNAVFKMMVYFMSAAAAGIILGARVPIMLTSRADPVAARLASVALTSIYAHSTSR